MADPTGSAPRSERRVSTLEWTIIAFGLGLALLLLVGGLLPARERDRKVREENERMADDVRELQRDLKQRRERIDDRKNDGHTIERELRDKFGTKDGEILLPKDAQETSEKAPKTASDRPRPRSPAASRRP